MRALPASAAAVVLQLAMTMPSLAQDATPPMRGAVTEDATNKDLIRRKPLIDQPTALDKASAPTPPADVPAEPYRPATPSLSGADRDDADTREQDSLFGQAPPAPAQEDVFDERPPLNAPLSPTQRRAAQNARRAAGEAETADVAVEAQRELRQGEAEVPDDGTEPITTGGYLPIGGIDAELELRRVRGMGRLPAIESLGRLGDANPYAPVGLRLGTFIIRPSIESGITATSNADSSPDGGSAVLSETTLRLNAVSDWAVNSAALEAYGTFRESISGQKTSETFAGILGTTTVGIGKDLDATASFGYDLRPESASTPGFIADTLEPPIHQILVGNLGLRKTVGKALFAVNGDVERNSYGDAQLATGGTISQGDRDNTLTLVKLRGGYEISPALTPFAEAELGRRLYDETFDINGLQRSSNRVGGRGGLAFDMGEKLSGEFSAGWLRETPDDEALQEISGPTIDGSVLWSPMRGTNVRLDAVTTVEGSTTPGESGDILYAGRLSVERQMRANLTANLAFGAGYRNYAGSDGEDTILSAEAGATYWFNRSLGLVGRARTETQTSNLPDRDYTTNSVYLGLRLQR